MQAVEVNMAGGGEEEGEGPQEHEAAVSQPSVVVRSRYINFPEHNPTNYWQNHNLLHLTTSRFLNALQPRNLKLHVVFRDNKQKLWRNVWAVRTLRWETASQITR